MTVAPGRPSRAKYIRGKVPQKDEHRINERIRVPQVRLIDETGAQVGIVDTRVALQMAKDRGLDLMEVAAAANPPVCKITDYGRFKYEVKKKEHQAKKNQVIIKIKEVQLRPFTDEHDLDFKVKKLKEFLNDGDKGKVSMVFRGRELSNTSAGLELMNKVVEMCQEEGVLESEPKLEGKKMQMVLAPKKKKAPKA